MTEKNNIIKHIVKLQDLKTNEIKNVFYLSYSNEEHDESVKFMWLCGPCCRDVNRYDYFYSENRNKLNRNKLNRISFCRFKLLLITTLDGKVVYDEEIEKEEAWKRYIPEEQKIIKNIIRYL